jgi:octanoyl-[GcvH]:protein N-octanoyltransferase
VDLLRGALEPGADAALEAAVAHALVRRVSSGESGPVLRVYRPHTPVVAFGRRDSRLPGFPAAVDAVLAAGFTPVIRTQGGRAVAYTEDSLVVDHVGPLPGPPRGLDERFRTYGELWAGLLREHGVDARVGEVPGEYCPGAYSVNARGQVKLVGTAQRMVRHAWLFSAVAIVDGADVVGPLLGEVYRILELPFDKASVGSIRSESAELTVERLEAAVIAAYDARFGLSPVELDDPLLSAARELADDHRPARP